MITTQLKAIFSFRSYHSLASGSRWYLLGFILYLFFFCLFVFQFRATGYISEQLPQALRSFPEISFDKGVLTHPKTKTVYTVPRTDMKIVFDASSEKVPSKEDFINQQQVMLVSGNKFYTPSAFGIQTQTIPESFTLTTSQEWLKKHQSALSATLSAMAFLSALLFLPFWMLFGICLSAATLTFFKIINKAYYLPQSLIWKWALFMLAPLSALWILRLWWPIPLFSFAQIILCIIYAQQIFNTLPEVK